MNILQATMRPMQALMKQRVFILGILAIGLVACSDPKGKYEVAVDDDRYDLLALNMPPLLKSDAKSCIKVLNFVRDQDVGSCLLYTSPSPRDATLSRMPSSA